VKLRNFSPLPGIIRKKERKRGGKGRPVRPAAPVRRTVKRGASAIEICLK
jgi:hypothetical protein